MVTSHLPNTLFVQQPASTRRLRSMSDKYSLTENVIESRKVDCEERHVLRREKIRFPFNLSSHSVISPLYKKMRRYRDEMTWRQFPGDERVQCAPPIQYSRWWLIASAEQVPNSPPRSLENLCIASLWWNAKPRQVILKQKEHSNYPHCIIHRRYNGGRFGVAPLTTTENNKHLVQRRRFVGDHTATRCIDC